LFNERIVEEPRDNGQYALVINPDKSSSGHFSLDANQSIIDSIFKNLFGDEEG
jgi:hypothetical protein